MKVVKEGRKGGVRETIKEGYFCKAKIKKKKQKNGYKEKRNVAVQGRQLDTKS